MLKLTLHGHKRNGTAQAPSRAHPPVVHRTAHATTPRTQATPRANPPGNETTNPGRPTTPSEPPILTPKSLNYTKIKKYRNARAPSAHVWKAVGSYSGQPPIIHSRKDWCHPSYPQLVRHAAASVANREHHTPPHPITDRTGNRTKNYTGIEHPAVGKKPPLVLPAPPEPYCRRGMELATNERVYGGHVVVEMLTPRTLSPCL